MIDGALSEGRRYVEKGRRADCPRPSFGQCIINGSGLLKTPAALLRGCVVSAYSLRASFCPFVAVGYMLFACRLRSNTGRRSAWGQIARRTWRTPWRPSTYVKRPSTILPYGPIRFIPETNTGFPGKRSARGLEGDICCGDEVAGSLAERRGWRLSAVFRSLCTLTLRSELVKALRSA